METLLSLVADTDTAADLPMVSPTPCTRLGPALALPKVLLLAGLEPGPWTQSWLNSLERRPPRPCEAGVGLPEEGAGVHMLPRSARTSHLI